MRAVKVIGLGIFFSFIGFVFLLFISVMRSGMPAVETNHATALSAVAAGILEALVNPLTLLVLVVAFVAAAWLTRKPKRASTS